MSDQLISREALKEAFKAWKTMDDYYHNTDCNNIPFSEAFDLIDNAPTVEPENAKESEIIKAYTKGFDTGVETVKDERPKGELKEYKPLELDYNVKSAVDNLKTAYWSNDTEKYAQVFTKAEEIIVNAICHHGYIVCKRPKGEPVIKCKDCKYRVKEWREDNRMKEKGYWVYGCKHFGEIMGYWGFGGNDNEFCSDAEQKGDAE